MPSVDSLKTPTGLPGLDSISHGGLPTGRNTLIAGTAGSGKTTISMQFLAYGIDGGEPGVFVTFEDTPEHISENVRSLGWVVSDWVDNGRFRFVDASPQPNALLDEIGSYSLDALLARVENAVTSIGAKRVVLDSVNALFAQVSDREGIRRDLFRLVSKLRALNTTVIITAERTADYGAISRHGIEEFVADNVIILRNVLERERRHRTIEILKFRGSSHATGEYSFTIMDGYGVVVIPLTAMTLTQPSGTERITTGVRGLNDLVGGGFLRDSIILVSGATGTGKTLMALSYLAAVPDDETAILFTFEESRAQLERNAEAFGIDLAALQASGRIRIEATYPHRSGPEEHFLRIRSAIAEHRPTRIAVDSLSALAAGSSPRAFREFVINLTATLKSNEVTGLFTSTAAGLFGGASVTDRHISTITDTIILLRYVEVLGDLRRVLTVLKMRGSNHESGIREFAIRDGGIHVENRFRHISGILSGGFRPILDQGLADAVDDWAREGESEAIAREAREVDPEEGV